MLTTSINLVSPRIQPKKKAPAFFLVLGLLISGLLLVGSGLAYDPPPAIVSPSLMPSPSAQVEKIIEQPAVPVHIKIPTAPIDTDIEEADIIDGEWQTSATAAAHLSQTGRPGENQNIVIYGHNLRVIFGPLWATKIGDRITVTTADGKQYEYIVFNKTRVKPTSIEYVLPTDKEILTLYTCVGAFDSDRLILQASPSGSRDI